MKALIKSEQNQFVKRYTELVERKRSRKKLQMLAVEGIQEIEYAIEGGYSPEFILISGEDIPSELIELESLIHPLDPSIFRKISYRSESSKALAVFHQKNSLDLHTPFHKVLVLENVEKPGNLGALFRTCLATGCDLLITTGESTDFYNSNCIRSSVGTVFRVPHIHLSNEEALEFLKKQDLSVFTTRLENGSNLYQSKLPERSAFVLGAEHQGISSFWAERELDSLYIPMKADMDSLNLSVSAAVVLYEHLRQNP